MNELYDINFVPKKQTMLTTIDNPFNPFTQWNEWLQYDLEKQHYTCQVLARFTHTSDDLSDEENKEEIEAAIDRIIEIDPEHKFKKVYES